MAGSIVSAGAEDVVYVKSGDAARGESRMTGVILSYTGDELQLQTPGGRVVNIPSDRVVHVESTWTDEQVRGDTLLGEHKWSEAIDSYRRAFPTERRPWVKNMIRAGILVCHRNLGQFEEASVQFLFLIESDPDTPFYDLIPLAWRPNEPSTSFARRASKWAKSTESPVAALIGASWLLSTSQRSAAMAALQRLSTHPDRRIAQLAITQLWRTQIASATPEQVDGWQAVVRQVPQPLQAGPYFVVGRAWAKQERHEQAALAFLRIPILYPVQRELAAESLWEAAGQLKRVGSLDEAAGLYRELVVAFPESPYADAARDELDRAQTSG
jgi:tetratricopeptide (TPR) repeat protein